LTLYSICSETNEGLNPSQFAPLANFTTQEMPQFKTLPNDLQVIHFSSTSKILSECPWYLRARCTFDIFHTRQTNRMYATGLRRKRRALLTLGMSLLLAALGSGLIGWHYRSHRQHLRWNHPTSSSKGAIVVEYFSL